MRVLITNWKMAGPECIADSKSLLCCSPSIRDGLDGPNSCQSRDNINQGSRIDFVLHLLNSACAQR